MRFPLLAAVAALAITASACAPLRSHQGYVVDNDLLNAVQPGVDNRQSVLATLGQPSFASQFNQGDWYYVSRDSRNYAFNVPKVRDQLTVQISFDQAGNVSAIRRWNAEQVVAIDPSKKVTPTLGRKRGFFQDLFGNIGTVGAAGAGGPSGP
ncbi:outer membrane protein assembly factor BamE [Sphingomonas sp. NBWT7]|uniref:outer membrane protein assembly factor BamE n=1 Tax=unclassified Sphingomonas TaxID=196159 RepID=UPI000A2715C2|nr:MULTISPECIES: outer membrane protein assembly factor BamE [unclassified Sphingomonas]QNE32885.1 outer membrane protein assembly factor BamE [Sphingomonas sp. NBWT7]